MVPELAASLSLHDHLQSRSLSANIALAQARDLAIRDREVVDVLELLSSITVCLGSFDYNDLASMSKERVQLSDSIYLAEYRLCQLEEASRSSIACSLPSSTSPGELRLPDEGHRGIDLSKSAMYAGHLFLHLALRGQAPSAPRHRALTQALMVSLCDTLIALDLLPSTHTEAYGSPQSHYSVGSLGNSSVESWSTTTTNTSIGSDLVRKMENDLHKNILLWALFVGSCVRLAAAPRNFQPLGSGDHHEFFIIALKNYCKMRGINDKGTFVAKLKDVIWLDSWCEHQVDMIWMEIGSQPAR